MYGQFGEQFRRQRPRARAFTFTEVLVVVCILGIASAVVLPQVGNRYDVNAAAAARTVMADLLYAQNRAISTQSMQYVNFDVAGQQYGLYSSMSPSQFLKHPVTLGDYLMTFGQNGPNNVSSDVTLTSASFNGQTTLAFDETGVPYSYMSGTATPLTAAGAIVLTCEAYSLTISVTKDTGEITVN
jgi:prepilin-type N-terminal cleavage/methylation domain-containing protein